MPKSPNSEVIARQHRILDLLAEMPRSTDELAHLLGFGSSTIANDLRSLRTRFPDQVTQVRGGDARTTAWQLTGLPPTPLPAAIDHLTADELTALLAARGLLRAPDVRTPGWEKPSTPYAGDLSAALHGLLERAGLQHEAQQIAPRTIGTSRFAVAAEPPGVVRDLERALRTGRSVRLRYSNRRGVERDLHLFPLRLVLIRGEAHLFAWAPESARPDTAGSLPGTAGLQPTSNNRPQSLGRVKQYRLSRIRLAQGERITLTDRHPQGLPTLRPHDEVDRMLATGFNATSSADPAAVIRITLAISPDAWPDVVGRTWGEGQRDEPAPEHGPDWRRLTFRTSGWQEARQWILSLGADARAEGPPLLIDWLREQTARMVSELTVFRTKMPGAIGNRIPGDALDQPLST